MLVAVPFDLDTLQIREGAGPEPVVAGIMQFPGTGAAQ
jgi:hypothetical protein